jgi:hypothetical protein
MAQDCAVDLMKPRTNTAVIARRDRATQYSRDASDRARSRGVLDRPVKPGDDSLIVAVA